MIIIIIFLIAIMTQEARVYIHLRLLLCTLLKHLFRLFPLVRCDILTPQSQALSSPKANTT